ncbi:MAG: hypothetical protein WC998_07700 [Candidatus Paceibacterota bacterium]|jgi:hypothetical protein
MTKKQFIAQIKSALGIEFMDRTVGAYFDQAFNTVTGQLFRSNPNQYSFYAKSYEVDVVQSKPRSYALFPVSVIQTTDTANGVRQIFTTGDDDLNFVPIPGIGFQIYKKLAVGRVSKIIGYLVKTDRVEFMWNMPTNITKVRMELVRPFSAYDDEEEFPLPDGSADIIIQMVLQMMNAKVDVKTNIYK